MASGAERGDPRKLRSGTGVAPHTEPVSDRAPSSTRVREAPLDGLRGLAVVMVLYYHYVLLTGLSTNAGNGFVGVLVFFVLSGYLITRILWGRPARAGAYARFVRRRFHRLYPALAGLVLVGVPVLAATGPESLGHDLESAAYALLQVTAFVEVGGWHETFALEPTWSLSVEWCFYLLWPLAVLAMSARGMRARTAAWVSAGAALTLYLVALPLSAHAFYFLPVANLGVMLAGAAIALLQVHRSEAGATDAGRPAGVAALALVLLVLLTLLPGIGTGHPGFRYLLLPATVAATCVVLDEQQVGRSPVRRLLGTRVMRGIGLSSYSIYLWHLPVLWAVWFALPAWSASARVLLALAVLVPVVVLSFTALERPVLRQGGSGDAQSRPKENVASRS